MDINGALIRNIIFPLMESVKGNQIRKNITYLQKTQSLPAGELKALQQGSSLERVVFC